MLTYSLVRGAEGTLIEGDDLSHMIWGLDPDTPNQIQHTRANSQHGVSSKPQTNVAAPIPPPGPPQSSQAPQSQNLSKATPYHRTDETITLSQNHLFRPKNLEPIDIHKLTGASTWNDMPPIHLSSNAYRTTPGHPLEEPPMYDLDGLGLDWKTLQRLHLNSTRDYNPQTSLKSQGFNVSAPAFVPASQTFENPHVFIEQRPPVYASPQPSALDIARQYQAKQRALAALPTPPNSSSPQWTPAFKQLNRLAQQDLSSFSPQDQLDGLYADRQNELSQELRNFVFDNMRGSDFNAYTSATQSIPRQHTPELESAPVFQRHNNDEHNNYHGDCQSSQHPGPPPNSPLPPIPLRYDLKNRLRANEKPLSLPSSTSPDPNVRMQAPPVLSTRKPRSIPFARMMQRRLSIVPEEDVGVLTFSSNRELHTPPPEHGFTKKHNSSTKTSDGNDMNVPESLSFRNSRFPDISNNTKGTTRLRQPANTQLSYAEVSQVNDPRGFKGRNSNGNTKRGESSVDKDKENGTQRGRTIARKQGGGRGQNKNKGARSVAGSEASSEDKYSGAEGFYPWEAQTSAAVDVWLQ